MTFDWRALPPPTFRDYLRVMKEKAMPKIRAGSTVIHQPSGEEWFVLGAVHERDELYPAGWPQARARVSDCTLVEDGDGLSEEESAARARMYPGKRWDD